MRPLAPPERTLVHEAPLAAKRVPERHEEQEAGADEDREEPERRAPAERLREYAAQDGPERWSKEGPAT